MAQNFSNFQSFLILGSEEARHAKRLELLRNLGLEFKDNSPDVFYLDTKKTPTTVGNISIEEIRTIKKHIFQKPVSLKSKVIVIRNAHKLTTEAQNAMLKILEEPPKHAILILEAENEFQLLSTILSRVIKINSLEQIDAKDHSFLKSALDVNLENLTSQDQATNYLDEQIVALYADLVESVKTQNWPMQKKLKNTITSCIASKKMLAANVNPRFVLTNLFLATQT